MFEYYLILASTAARRSVFWNNALMSCFISFGVNSTARGPFPSAHLSAISSKLAFRTVMSSVNLNHFGTFFCSSKVRLTSDVEVWSSAGARSLTRVRSMASCRASSDEMSSRTTTDAAMSTTTEWSRVPVCEEYTWLLKAVIAIPYPKPWQIFIQTAWGKINNTWGSWRGLNTWYSFIVAYTKIFSFHASWF